jgi:hypothetical protein
MGPGVRPDGAAQPGQKDEGGVTSAPVKGGDQTLRPAGRRRWTDRYASGPSTAATALTVPLGT